MVSPVTSSTATTTNTLASTGSNIVSTLSSGSGIDSNALITKLVDVNKAVESNRLTTKQTNLEAQISDFGLLRSAFSTLQSAAAPLGNPDTFNAKSVAVPTTNLLSITKLDAKAAAGQYAVNVDQVAQSQSISSTGYGSQTATIGKGTLAIRFGTWNPGATSFTVDSTKTGGTITIDDSNNSLQGLRDAINKANLGVRASVVSDGGLYKLLVTAPSGASSEVEITATEDVSSPGLASFNFNNTTRNFSQQQGGSDAVVRVNGMQFTRTSNHLTDVIEGLELDLNNSSTTETVNIGITEDKSVAEKSIRDFVAAYNTFLKSTEKLVGFDTEKNQYGSLHNDPLAKKLVQQVRSQLSANVTGLGGNYTTFASLGIRTEIGDGSLTVDDSANATSFKSILANNYDSVRDLFISKTSSTNAQINITKNTAKSIPGTYAVNITAQPAKGKLIGAAATIPNDSTAKTYSFTASIDGIATASISLPTKNYATGAELAADIQSKINADTSIVAARVAVGVSFNTTTQKLEFTSSAYGSSSKVDITAASADMADFGLSVATGTPGTDVSGTVDSKAGFGLGNVLLPALGSNAEGLSMQIEPGATSGNITYSRGFANNFTSLITDFLSTQGLIKSRETSISKDVDKVKSDMVVLDKRSDSYKARLQAQFAAMETIVRSLKTTGTFLTNAFKNNNNNNN